jgi:hypothetical protein
MHQSEIIINHFAQQLVDSVLNPDSRVTPDTAIAYSKNILQDPTLSQWHSKKVKKILIHILSNIILKNFYFQAGPSQICRQISYFDGTESIEIPEKITYNIEHPLYRVVSPKPTSPWYNLTFEDFIKAYCQARLQLKPKTHHSLLTTYSSLQTTDKDKVCKTTNPLLTSSL